MQSPVIEIVIITVLLCLIAASLVSRAASQIDPIQSCISHGGIIAPDVTGAICHQKDMPIVDQTGIY
jgi:hypothetical protein